jgi:hypothetical protein
VSRSSLARTCRWRRRATTVSHSAPDFVRQRQQDVDRRIERAGGQLPLELAPLGPHNADVDARCTCRDAAHQSRQDDGFDDIAHTDGEPLHRARRIEPVDLVYGHLEVLQGSSDRLDEAARQRRRCHGASMPGKERVVEHLTQAAERVADGRLRQVESSACARDAALRVDGVEHHEQVEVDLCKMHGIETGRSVNPRTARRLVTASYTSMTASAENTHHILRPNAQTHLSGMTI